MSIYFENRQKRQKLNLRRRRASVKKILAELACSEADVSVVFVNDAQIRDFNRTYLARDNATNVISFSMREGEFSDVNPSLLGDIVISVDTALRDAKREGIPLEDEVDYLLIHGILHLLGYDHERSGREAAQKMEKIQNDLFLRLKGYALDR
jgi:probable rRNA maturation factor